MAANEHFWPSFDSPTVPCFHPVEDIMADLPPDAPLTLDKLATPDAIIALGALAARMLAEGGGIGLYTDPAGTVLACELYEVSMDAIPEDQAIQVLIDRGYTDDRLESYLRGRDARRRLLR